MIKDKINNKYNLSGEKTMKKYIIVLLVLFCAFVLNASLASRARIIPVNASIRISYDGKNWEKEISKPKTVNGKVWIETGKLGYARILFQDRSEVKLMPDTVIRLQGKSIYIKNGQTWFKVEKTMKGLIIKTPTAIAGIRGTVFEVNVVSEKKTSFYVYEGKIYILRRRNSLTKDLEMSSTASVLSSSISENSEFSVIKRENKYWSEKNWNLMYIKHLSNKKMLENPKLFNNSFPKIKLNSMSNLLKKVGTFRIQPRTKKVTIESYDDNVDENMPSEEETDMPTKGDNIQDILDRYK